MNAPWIIVAFLCFVSVNSEKCATPDSKEGECMILSDCPKLKAIVDKQNITQKEFKFYVRSHCAGNDTKVCCQVSEKTRPFQLPAKQLDIEDRFISGQRCGRVVFEPDKIIGDLAALGEFPWMALLKFKKGKSEGYACGGALISKRYVVTAAHCFIGPLGEPFEVTLGEHDVNSEIDCDYSYSDEGDCAKPIQAIPIEKYVLHPDYSKRTPGKPNDIALIRLKYPCNFTAFIQPICLPDQTVRKEVLNTNKLLFVAGWGETQNHGPRNIKRKAALPLVDLDTCKKKKTYPLRESQMCAGGGGQDSCLGDSGGPLMGCKIDDDFNVVWYMLGIVSMGPEKCATIDSPGIYTNIVPYVDWIKNTIEP